MGNNHIYNVEKGDFVSIYNQDYTVDQVIKLGTGNNNNVNILIKDGSLRKWLCLRNYGEVFFVLCDEMTLEIRDFTDQLSYNNNGYDILNKGSVRAIATSNLGYPQYINIDFFDYLRKDKLEYLFVQIISGKVTFMIGEPVISTAIMVYPRPK
ncbi:DUF4178 domain-containing protein [Candidatus Contubernalis alkaliaceticus]|uniref:DUF4178 domain-containing protein n=1 Tax=Candidatus Contubernalis alkaliaceticus TaxID=338645 RepID=UPI001F4C1BC6|nr:DUF4178 domain-containing protein [Candidatus Contubernalis alkalaceticus]UNC91562.1 hypothetical protein HUE98_05355 [Candidatus Contubernalis alkalaceticus]